MLTVESRRMSFDGPRGQRLEARLDVPSDAEPEIFVLVAHCFTCSKDLIALRQIARRLAGRGLGVLRFDFTGIGGSEGDFADTNFSTNVEDIVAAVQFMRRELKAPNVLVGHSLGGTAMLKAAALVEECEVLCTIAAPFEPAYTLRFIEDEIPTIERDGEAVVVLAGRKIRLKRQFLEDLRAAKLDEAIADLNPALLVLHSPADRTVEISQGEKIFAAAPYPKSFVSLDGAGHLLGESRDAHFVAESIAGWAERNLGGE